MKKKKKKEIRVTYGLQIQYFSTKQNLLLRTQTAIVNCNIFIIIINCFTQLFTKNI